MHDAVPAYGSIVGAGANACVLHYVANNAQAKDGDLVLVDAGAERVLAVGDFIRGQPDACLPVTRSIIMNGARITSSRLEAPPSSRPRCPGSPNSSSRFTSCSAAMSSRRRQAADSSATVIAGFAKLVDETFAFGL